MNCSKCGKTLEAMGLFGGLFSSSVSVLGAGSASDFEMWRAQVCPKCKLVFCDGCLDLGGPTPCPECGNPTEPAYRGTLNAMGGVRRLAVGTTNLSGTPMVGPKQEAPHDSAEDAEVEDFRRLVKARVEDLMWGVSNPGEFVYPEDRVKPKNGSR